MKFSEKLAAAMHEKNISIRELSEMTGVPKSAIQRYTSGETEKIPIDRMQLMAEALGIDPAYIMGWSDSAVASDAHAHAPVDADDSASLDISIIDLALSGEIRWLTDAEKEDVLEYIRFKRAQKARKDNT